MWFGDPEPQPPGSPSLQAMACEQGAAAARLGSKGLR